jgi:hypothetical protein
MEITSCKSAFSTGIRMLTGKHERESTTKQHFIASYEYLYEYLYRLLCHAFIDCGLRHAEEIQVLERSCAIRNDNYLNLLAQRTKKEVHYHASANCFPTNSIINSSLNSGP